MKLRNKYRCSNCGNIENIADIHIPASDGYGPATNACNKCGCNIWLPIKGS